MSLGITANREKNGALLAYIAKCIPGINLRKLLKIVYLIDEKSMRLRCYPLTWFDYYAWAKGPVAPEIYEIKNDAFSDFVTCKKDANGKRIVESALDNKYQVLKLMDVFSQYEIDFIDEIISKFSDYSADELTSLTHTEDSLWSKTVKENDVKFVDGKSNIRIPIETINGDNKEKNNIFEDAKWNVSFQASLNKHNSVENVPTT